MRKILGLIAGIMAMLMVASCGSTKVSTNGMDIPDWYFNEPDSKEGIYGNGQAKMHDMDVSVKMAQADARNSLAKKVNVVIKDVAQSMVSGSKEDTMKGFEENSIQTVEATLNGVRQTNMYISKDGTVYIQMFLPYETQVAALNKTANDYHISEEYLATQVKMQEAYDKYFKK